MRNAWMIFAGLALLAGPALAQSEDAAETAAKPGAKVLAGKKLACKQSGVKERLRGDDLKDHMAVCIEEARLACLKQAIAQKVRGPERKDYLGKCLNADS